MKPNSSPIFTLNPSSDIVIQKVPTQHTLNLNRLTATKQPDTLSQLDEQSNAILNSHWVTLQKNMGTRSQLNSHHESLFIDRTKKLVNLITSHPGINLPIEVVETYASLQKTLQAHRFDQHIPMLLNTLTEFVRFLKTRPPEDYIQLCAAWPGNPPPACIPGYNEALTELLNAPHDNTLKQKMMAVNQQWAQSLIMQTPDSLNIHLTPAIWSITTTPRHEISDIDPFYQLALFYISSNQAFKIMSDFPLNVAYQLAIDLDQLNQALLQFSSLNHPYVNPYDTDLSEDHRQKHQRLALEIKENPVLSAIEYDHNQRFQKSISKHKTHPFNASKYIHETILKFDEDTEKNTLDLTRLHQDYNQALSKRYEFSDRFTGIGHSDLFNQPKSSSNILIQQLTQGSIEQKAYVLNLLYSISGSFQGNSLPLALDFCVRLGKYNNPPKKATFFDKLNLFKNEKKTIKSQKKSFEEGINTLKSLDVASNSLLKDKLNRIIENLEFYKQCNPMIASYLMGDHRFMNPTALFKSLLQDNAPIELLPTLPNNRDQSDPQPSGVIRSSEEAETPSIYLDLSQLPFHPQKYQLITQFKDTLRFEYNIKNQYQFLKVCCELDDAQLLNHFLPSLHISALHFTDEYTGDTVAHLATRIGRFEILKALDQLTSFDVATVTNEYQSTPLISAAIYGQLDMLKWLISKPNANINHSDDRGYNTLLTASISGNRPIIDTLLTVPNININSYSHNGYNALMIALTTQHTDIALQLIDAGIDLHHLEENGYSAFFIASKTGNTTVLKKLLTLDAIDINQRHKDGYHALLLSIVEAHTEASIILIEAGINLDFISKEGHNYLLLAISINQYDVVKALLNRTISLNHANRHGETALTLAAELGSDELLELLLAQPSLNLNSTKKNGDNALMLAVQSGSLNKVNRILNHAPYLASRANNNGVDALAYATANNHLTIVKALLQVDGAVYPSLQYGHELNPLVNATKQGNLELVTTLTESNKLPPKQYLAHYTSALNIAGFDGFEEIANVLKQALALP